ncbi:hypothetical protein EBZ35_02015, partial [bacterium]|nr:hypothetical protein [bacterium]
MTNEAGRSEVIVASGSQTVSDKVLVGGSMRNASLQNVIIASASITEPLMLLANAPQIQIGNGRDLVVALDNDRNMGIGVSAPLAKLDVDGAIRVGRARPDSAPGSISFESDGGFYGTQLDGTQIRLGDTTWKRYDGGHHVVTNESVGIGMTRAPDATLEVGGEVKATSFIGSGERLTNLSPTALSASVGVSKGGTGLAAVPSGSLLVGTGSDAMTTVSMVGQDPYQVLMATPSGPAVRAIEVGTGLGREMSETGIRLFHPPGTMAQGWYTAPDGMAITGVSLDALGHVSGVVSANLDARYYTKLQLDTQLRDLVGVSSGLMQVNALRTTEDVRVGRDLSVLGYTTLQNMTAQSVTVNELQVNGVLRLSQPLQVSAGRIDDLTSDGLTVTQRAVFDDQLRVNGMAVLGNMSASESRLVSLYVTQNASIKGGMAVGGLAQFNEVTVTQSARIDGTLSVKGDTTFNRVAATQLRVPTIQTNEIVINRQGDTPGSLVVDGWVSANNMMANDWMVRGGTTVNHLTVLGTLTTYQALSLGYRESNLLEVGYLRVTDNMLVMSPMTVLGDSTLANLSAASAIMGPLTVTNDAQFRQGVRVSGDAVVTNLKVLGTFETAIPMTVAEVTASMVAADTLKILQQATVSGDLKVDGLSTLSNLIAPKATINELAVDVMVVRDTATINQRLVATGWSVLATVNMTDALTEGLRVSRDASIVGALDVRGKTTLGELVVASATIGEWVVTQNASVLGRLTLHEGAMVSGNLAIKRDVMVSGNVTTDGQLTGQTLQIQSGEVAGNLTVRGALILSSKEAIQLGETKVVTINADSAVMANVKAGELSASQNVWFDRDLSVKGRTWLAEATIPSATIGVLNVTQNATLANDLNVGGTAWLATTNMASAVVSQSLTVRGDMTVKGMTNMAQFNAITATMDALTVGTLRVSRNVTIDGSLGVMGQFEPANLSVPGITRLEQVWVNQLKATQNATFLGGVTVTGTANLTEAMVGLGTISQLKVGSLEASKSVTIQGNLTVLGQPNFDNITAKSLTLSGGMRAAGVTINYLAVSADARVSNNLMVSGVGQLNQLEVANVAEIKSLRADSLTVSNNTVLNGMLTVSGPSSLGNVAVGGVAEISALRADSLTVTNSTTLTGPLTVLGSATMGRMTITEGADMAMVRANQLQVTQNARFKDGVTVSGNSVMEQLTVGNVAMIQQLKVNDLGVTNNVTLMGNLSVSGNTRLNTLEVINTANIRSLLADRLNVTSDLTVQGTLTVQNKTMLSNVDVTGVMDAATLKSDALYIRRNSELLGTLSVAGDTTLANMTATLGGFDTIKTRQLVVSNNSTLKGDLSVSGETSLGNLYASSATLPMIWGTDIRATDVNASRNVTVVGTLRSVNLARLNSADIADATIKQLTVTTDATIVGDMMVGGGIRVTGNVQVTGNVGVRGNLDVRQNIAVTGNMMVKGNTELGGTLGVAQDVTLARGLMVNGIANMGMVEVTQSARVQSLWVTDNATVKGSVGVSGNATITGALDVTGRTTLTTAGINQANIAGLTVYNDASVGGNLGVTGNTTLTGTLGVMGKTQLSSMAANESTIQQLSVPERAEMNQVGVMDLRVTRNATVNQDMTVGGGAQFRGDMMVMGISTLSDVVVTRNMWVRQGLGVSQNTTLEGQLTVAQLAQLTQLDVSEWARLNTLQVTRDAQLGRDLRVSRNAQVTGELMVSGLTTLSTAEMESGRLKQLNVTGNTQLNGDLRVEGESVLAGDVRVSGFTTLANVETGQLTASSVRSLSDINVGRDVNVVRNVGIDGTLGVAGATSLQNTLGVAGATSLQSSLDVAGMTTLRDGMDVAGPASLRSLRVTDNTSVGGTLGVAGATSL